MTTTGIDDIFLDDGQNIVRSPRESFISFAAKVVGQHPDYRILRRLSLATPWPETVDWETTPHKTGAIVDVETTGVDPKSDAIIELSIVKFLYTEDGQHLQPASCYTALENPGRPLPAKIVELTGLTDAQLEGQAFDTAEVERFVGDVDLCVAHNAGFDRRFVERRFHDSFDAKPWACTYREIPWEGRFGSCGAKLGNVLIACGWFSDLHRSQADAYGLARCLATVEPHDADAPRQTALTYLLKSARETTVRFDIYRSPFEMKETLKARGYRGDRWVTDRVWYVDVPEGMDSVAETAWLRQQDGFGFRMKRLTARDRYSVRA